MIERFGLDGRVCVVTGAGRGIGRGIALGLAAAGAHVVVAARRTREIDAVAHEIEVLGGHAHAVTTDVRREDDNERLAAAAVDRFGRIDAWISNAGGSDEPVRRNLADTPLASWDEQVQLNLTAPFLGARAAAARLGSGGAIVMVSSMAARRPSANNGPYAAAKAGVNQLTATRAAELAPRGIRVSAVAPGPVPTEVFMEALRPSPDQLPAIGATIPLGRLGEPDDVAAAVVYLVSPAAAWVTGQVLTVAGGLP